MTGWLERIFGPFDRDCKYGDWVAVRYGFYAGQEGVVIDWRLEWREGAYRRDYLVDLRGIGTKWLCAYEVEPVAAPTPAATQGAAQEK